MCKEARFVYNEISIIALALVQISYSLSTSLSMAFEHLTSSTKEFSCCCGTAAVEAAMVILIICLISRIVSGLMVLPLFG